MGTTPGGCRDLRKYQETNQVMDAFSRLVSGGKMGYKTVIEKKVEEIRCPGCRSKLEGVEKFCPNCGEKTEWQKRAEKPLVLLTSEELEKKFNLGPNQHLGVLFNQTQMKSFWSLSQYLSTFKIRGQ